MGRHRAGRHRASLPVRLSRRHRRPGAARRRAAYVAIPVALVLGLPATLADYGAVPSPGPSVSALVPGTPDEGVPVVTEWTAAPAAPTLAGFTRAGRVAFTVPGALVDDPEGGDEDRAADRPDPAGGDRTGDGPPSRDSAAEPPSPAPAAAAERDPSPPAEPPGRAEDEDSSTRPQGPPAGVPDRVPVPRVPDPDPTPEPEPEPDPVTTRPGRPVTVDPPPPHVPPVPLPDRPDPAPVTPPSVTRPPRPTTLPGCGT